ncbi:diguanylate cyclase [Roseomonas elaeocarpi]|uniref:diguanylate cyclase n=1 Tax=Roseomonas elaeocarpi TaxID=907779 RepID=A0ABV6JRK2_9PROT
MKLSLRWQAALMVLLTLGFCGLSGLMLWEMRREAWNNNIRSSHNLLAAISQDVNRNLEIYSLSLQAVADGLDRADVRAASPEIQDLILYDRAATAQYLDSILVLDESGKVILDSKSRPPRSVQAADRDYFTVHRDRADAGLYVSLPFRSSLSGNEIIGVSLRRDHPDGSFAGIVLGTIRLAYFQELFSRLKLGPGDAVNMFRTDGTLLVRVPSGPDQVGRNIAGAETFRRFTAATSGEFVAKSAIDGVERAYVFEHVGQLPLIVDVALSVRGIYAGWQNKAVVLAAVLLLLCAAAVGLSMLLTQELRRRQAAELAARRSGEQYRLLADNATDLIMRFDAGRVPRYVSPGSRTLGLSPEELREVWSSDLVHPEDRESAEAPWHAAQEEGRSEATYRLRHRDGHYVWMEARYSRLPGDSGFTVVARDVGKRKAVEIALQEANEELARLASTDALTGLFNRRAFDDMLRREWRRAIREGGSVALLMIDADHFKAYNDHYGHQGGDAVLSAIANSIAQSVRRPGDTAARYGGEEFAVILSNTDTAGARDVAERIRQVVEGLALPHAMHPARVVTVSIGVSSARPQRGQEPAPLLAAADAALYDAKAAGRDTVRQRGVEAALDLDRHREG